MAIVFCFDKWLIEKIEKLQTKYGVGCYSITKFEGMTQSYCLNPKAELIDVSEEVDRIFWALRLGVSIEKLKSAIKATQSLDYQELKKYLLNRQMQND